MKLKNLLFNQYFLQNSLYLVSKIAQIILQEDIKMNLYYLIKVVMKLEDKLKLVQIVKVFNYVYLPVEVQDQD